MAARDMFIGAERDTAAVREAAVQLTRDAESRREMIEEAP